MLYFLYQDTKSSHAMKRTDLVKIIEKLTSQIDAIQDEKTKSIQQTLLNLVELLYAENEELRVENQSLKDEVNRLKGEQGAPRIRKQKKNNDDDDKGSSDHSSEENRKGLGGKKRKRSDERRIQLKLIERLNLR